MAESKQEKDQGKPCARDRQIVKFEMQPKAMGGPAHGGRSAAGAERPQACVAKIYDNKSNSARQPPSIKYCHGTWMAEHCFPCTLLECTPRPLPSLVDESVSSESTMNMICSSHSNGPQQEGLVSELRCGFQEEKGEAPLTRKCVIWKSEEIMPKIGENSASRDMFQRVGVLHATEDATRTSPKPPCRTPAGPECP